MITISTISTLFHSTTITTFIITIITITTTIITIVTIITTIITIVTIITTIITIAVITTVTRRPQPRAFGAAAGSAVDGGDVV